MSNYYSMEWDTLPHFIITSDTDWDLSVAWFDTFLDSSKLEYHGTFDMHGDYFDWNISQYTEIYYFNANTYDE